MSCVIKYKTLGELKIIKILYTCIVPVGFRFFTLHFSPSENFGHLKKKLSYDSSTSYKY